MDTQNINVFNIFLEMKTVIYRYFCGNFIKIVNIIYKIYKCCKDLIKFAQGKIYKRIR